MAANPFCMNQGCGSPSVDLHHAAGRNGKRLNYKPRWLALYRPCHNLCKDRPKLAEEVGLNVSRHRPLEG